MEFSGRTTDYAHKRDDWKEKGLNVGKESIQQVTIFEVQWSNCPVEVEEEVSKLWRDYELWNDVCYYSWSGESEDYPLISTYLKEKGIEKCLIHWWW